MLHLSRYNKGKESFLTCPKRSNSSTALSKVIYHSSKIANLQPIEEKIDKSSKKENDIETVDEIGIQKTLTNIKIQKKKIHSDLNFPEIPSIPLEITKSVENLILEKINLCKLLCDFSDPDSDVIAKNRKILTLKEILNLISNPSNILILTEKIKFELFEMIFINLNRPIPLIDPNLLNSLDEPIIIDINWPHLSLIYNILNTFLTKLPNDLIFINNFHKKILHLLHSCDNNERDQLIIFLENYVNIFPERELQIIHDLSNLLIGYKEKKHSIFCVTPILKFYSLRFKTNINKDNSILPLYKNKIIPLITCQHIQTIYNNFLLIATNLFNIDKSIVLSSLRRIFLHWPESNASKQIYFINLIIFFLEKINLKDFEKIISQLFKILVKCSQSNHYKIVETSLEIWSNINIIPKILENSKKIYPIIFPALNLASKEHWRKSTQNLILTSLKSMHDIDPFMFDELNKNKILIKDNSENLQKNWAKIARAAASVDKNINLARLLAELQTIFNPLKIDNFIRKKALSPPPNISITIPLPNKKGIF